MTFHYKNHKNDFLFLPLGGSGEIGMNLNFYHLDGKWIALDCGAGFAEDFLPGVDMIVPNIESVHAFKDDLIGIVLTHAHEDHLGAIPYLWEELGFPPVYATPFTATFLRAKLEEFNLIKRGTIHEVAPGSSFDVGPFNFEMIGLTHSVPEMNAVAVKTRYGTVLHTGDWKLDPDPMVGPVSDEAKLKAFGDKGVLAMVCDSTNIFKEGHSGSEGELRKSLTDLIAPCKQLVGVTTFASNIARIETIAKAAEAAGRRVLLSGRSLWRIVRVAQDTGYLQDIPPFLDEEEFSRMPREELLVLSTGCQGEPLASTNKIATGVHRTVHMRPGDTMIFSSKVIPGNEKRIFRLFNKFVQMGVEVLTEKDHFVHVSGHPNKDELKRMYELVRPKLAIPVHGEHVHIHEHARLAKEWGAKESIQVGNGDVVYLGPEAPRKLANVPCGILAIDGNFLTPPDSSVMKARRRMQKEGIVIITLLLNKGRLAKAPLVMAPGLLDLRDDSDLIFLIKDEIKLAVEDSIKHQRKKAGSNVEQVARAAARRILRQEVGKEPMIEVQVEHV